MLFERKCYGFYEYSEIFDPKIEFWDEKFEEDIYMGYDWLLFYIPVKSYNFKYFYFFYKIIYIHRYIFNNIYLISKIKK